MDVLSQSEGRRWRFGPGTRRRWSNEERLEIIAAVGVNGETLARVARRYDVSRSQIG